MAEGFKAVELQSINLCPVLITYLFNMPKAISLTLLTGPPNL